MQRKRLEVNSADQISTSSKNDITTAIHKVRATYPNARLVVFKPSCKNYSGSETSADIAASYDFLEVIAPSVDAVLVVDYQNTYAASAVVSNSPTDISSHQFTANNIKYLSAEQWRDNNHTAIVQSLEKLLQVDTVLKGKVEQDLDIFCTRFKADALCDPLFRKKAEKHLLDELADVVSRMKLKQENASFNTFTFMLLPAKETLPTSMQYIMSTEGADKLDRDANTLITKRYKVTPTNISKGNPKLSKLTTNSSPLRSSATLQENAVSSDDDGLAILAKAFFRGGVPPEYAAQVLRALVSPPQQTHTDRSGAPHNHNTWPSFFDPSVKRTASVGTKEKSLPRSSSASDISPPTGSHFLGNR